MREMILKRGVGVGEDDTSLQTMSNRIITCCLNFKPLLKFYCLN